MKFFGAIALAILLTAAAGRAATSAPLHIPTWAVDENFAEGANASPDEVQRYVTYAQGGLGNNKAEDDCAGSNRCSSVFYFDPGLVYDSTLCPYSGDKTFLAAAHENWFIHLPGYSDAAHRVRGTYTQNCKGAQVQVPVYAINQANPAVAGYFASYLQRNADGWDFYEMDDTGGTLVDQFYGPGGGFCKGDFAPNGYCTRTQEMVDDQTLAAAHRAFVDRLNHRNGSPMRIFYNGVSFGPDGPRTDLLRLDRRFVGAICENCVVNDGALRANMYPKVLDAMAMIDRIRGASFVELNTGKAPAGSDDEIAQRLVTTAVAWLGFSPGHTIVWPNLEFDTTNLAVWPEDRLYPEDPRESMVNGSNDLEVATSVWRREFAACFRDGDPIGPCAAIVNGSDSTVAFDPRWLPIPLHHQVLLRGGDVLSAGTIAIGPIANLSLASGHAVLLVR